MRKDHKFTANDIKYLQLLAQSFPNISEASTEIINLQAILNLPKARSISLQTFMVNTRRSCIF